MLDIYSSFSFFLLPLCSFFLSFPPPPPSLLLLLSLSAPPPPQVVQNATMKYVSDLQAVVCAELSSLLRALESRIGHCGPIWRLFTNLGTVGLRDGLSALVGRLHLTANHSRALFL